MAYVILIEGAVETKQVWISDDSITWTAVSSPTDTRGGIGITYGQGKFVALPVNGSPGDTFIDMNSVDNGNTWSTNSIPQHFQYIAVLYVESLDLFVAIDFLTGKVINSSDAVTWTDEATLGSNDNGWRGLAFGAGLIVAIGGDDASGVVVATSPDGSTWTTRTAPHNLWGGICYGGGQFVAVGGPNQPGGGLIGPSCVMTSPDGIDWTSQSPAGGSDRSWFGVAYGAGRYVAVAADDVGSIMTSTDGVSWSTLTVADSDFCYSIIWDGHQFIVCRFAAGTSNVLTSPDGLTWTTQTTPAASTTLTAATIATSATPCDIGITCDSPPAGTVGIPYSHTFPATGHASPSFFFSLAGGTLPPGLSLDPGSGLVSGTPTTAGSYSFTVEVQEGRFVCAKDDAGAAGKTIMISPDAATWTELTTPLASSGDTVAFGAGLYVMGSEFNGGPNIATSPDAITWTARSSPADSHRVIKVIYGGGQFVALLQFASSPLMTSPDGITWTGQSAPTPGGQPWAVIAYSPDLGIYACINAVGNIMTSPDAVTWTLLTGSGPDGVFPNADSMACMSWGAGKFVALGGSPGGGGNELTSTDGLAWPNAFAPGGYTEPFQCMVFADGAFVAASDSDDQSPPQAGTSTDGTTWSLANSAVHNWDDMTFGAGLYVACSGDGPATDLIMTSPDGATWTSQTTPSVQFCLGLAFGPNGNGCSASVTCSITISAGTTFGNCWDGMTNQPANSWA